MGLLSKRREQMSNPPLRESPSSFLFSMTKQSTSLFVVAVEKVVRAIPRGQVMSYGAVAIKSGFPGASRAVGTLLKKNFDPSIPCHRVIRSDGKLGEYNRGTRRKATLLEQEGVVIENGRVRKY
jgi:O-6-methylguanine DNA methyltransferase